MRLMSDNEYEEAVYLILKCILLYIYIYMVGCTPSNCLIGMRSTYAWIEDIKRSPGG